MTTIEKSKLRAALLAASDDETRHDLYGVHWHPRGFVEATNAHWAIRIPNDPSGVQPGHFLARKDTAALAEQAPRAGNVEHATQNSSDILRGQNGLHVRMERIGKRSYPNLDRFLDPHEPMAESENPRRFALSAAYLEAIAKAARELCGRDWSAVVVFEPDEDPALKACRFRVVKGGHEHAHGAIMPVRLD